MSRATCLRRYATRKTKTSDGPLPVSRPGWQALTLVASDSDALVESARALLPAFARDAAFLVCALSRTLPRDRLGAAVSLVQSCESGHTIGALTDALPANEGSEHALSVAAFRVAPGKRVVPFRSTVPGRQRVSLGREVTHETGPERAWPAAQREGRDWTEAWSQPGEGLRVPGALADLDPATVSQLFMLSDDAPEGLLSTLDDRFPLAAKHGVVGASTPFVTGRPFTLLDSASIHSDGAVGFALCHDEPLTQPVDRPRVAYNGLTPLGRPLTVTDAQGNIILTLDGKPATKLLVDLLDKLTSANKRLNVGDDKDTEYYLGRVDHASTSSTVTCTSVSRIVSGSPSKGVMAIDTEDSYAPDTVVQLYYRPRVTPLFSHPSLVRPSTPLAFSVLAAGDDGVRAPRESATGAPARCLTDVWLAASEHGHIAGGFRRPARVCSVPGSVASLHPR